VKQRVVNFPSNAPYGTTHYEHGRTWEFVEPGIWKSVGGDGSDLDIHWDDIDGKPTEYPPEAHGHQQGEIDGLEDRLDQIEQSIGNGGGGSGGGGDVYWDDVLDKPVQIENLAAENAGKVSMISGGSY
jgi:hypothetical protein